MELQQLRYVVAVAEEANFTRAAAKCFVVQSALSHQIKRLEEELGVALFNRTSRRVELTAAGAAFVEEARSSLEHAERAAVEAAAAAGHIRGHLSVGVIPTVTAIDMPAALKIFRKAHPQVHISLQVAGSHELEAAISSGAVDIGLLGLPQHRRPRGVAWRHLMSDESVAVVSSAHPLAGGRQLRLADLAEEVFADFPAGTPVRIESDQAFTAIGINRNVAFESIAIDLIIALVQEDLAITLLPSKYVDHHPDLVSVPIAGGPTRSEYLAWSNFNPSPATQAFLQIVGATDN
ncbi:LysR family transcriptional regulator [uncultured Citricoccus sp.]|uniref:LysR family transcriptional regulator n=1 Tax=uncultured Citricoccus sp. TaxID=614031 RepID=UPI00262FD7B9|nr:LysR family transcriptional regulator [uncultured Citricoccus sp.]